MNISKLKGYILCFLLSLKCIQIKNKFACGNCLSCEAVNQQRTDVQAKEEKVRNSRYFNFIHKSISICYLLSSVSPFCHSLLPFLKLPIFKFATLTDGLVGDGLFSHHYINLLGHKDNNPSSDHINWYLKPQHALSNSKSHIT